MRKLTAGGDMSQVIRTIAAALAAAATFYFVMSVTEHHPMQQSRRSIVQLPKTINGTTCLQESFTGSAKFHLAISVCGNSNWARYFTSSMLSAWLNGVNPQGVTAIWCGHENKTAPSPSLWFNLRRSGIFRIMYVRDELPDTATSVLYTAMTIPGVLQQRDLPVLLVRGDAMFDKDFNFRLAAALQERKAMDPDSTSFMLSLNHPHGKIPADDWLSKYVQSTTEFAFELHEGVGPSNFGADSVYFSAPMVQLLETELQHTLKTGAHSPEPEKNLHNVLTRLQCLVSDKCQAFGIRPSILNQVAPWPQGVHQVGANFSVAEAGKQSNAVLSDDNSVPMPGADEASVW